MSKLVLLFGIASVVACSGAPSGAPNEIAFHAEQDVLPNFKVDTGLQPSSGPVQLQLVVSSTGKVAADAVGVGTDEDGAHSLVAKAASGKLAIDGGFVLDGHLKVDVGGLAKYDGDVPGLADASITFSGSSVFDPFLLATTSDVSAPIVGKLPSIPLPGGLPGTLDLTIEPGTALQFSLHGTCLALDGDQATYRASLERSGTVKITPTITLKVPIVGSKQFKLPVVDVALPQSPADLDFGTHMVAFASGHIDGERATGTQCSAVVANDGGSDGGTDGSRDASADAKPDAPTYNPVSASCSTSGFEGTLTLEPSADGSQWVIALLAMTGGSGTHNNATIWRETDYWQNDVLAYAGTTKVLDTTDDWVANDPPRAITSWTPQSRASQTSGSIKVTYRYYAKIVFDKLGTDPNCVTEMLDDSGP